MIRDKDTGLSKGFGFVSMQASDGAKKALLKQVKNRKIGSLEEQFLLNLSRVEKYHES